MKKFETVELRLDTIVGGGQSLGTHPDGRKLFVWGGLPGELVRVQITKKKTSYAEGIVVDIIEPSVERVEPRDPESYLSTSPWQIMSFEAEQRYKAQLIREAFELHHISLPEPVEVYTDGREYHYRNKVEFSWYSDTDPKTGADTLDLAFFRRGSKGKIIVEGSALLPSEITVLARAIRDILRAEGIAARQLKTLLIRSDQAGNCVWQLYVKDTPCDFAGTLMKSDLPAQGGEVIYSNPKSPASVITERLASTGDIALKDTILGVPFRYATEGFFQVNIPVYEQALRDMRVWVVFSAFSPPSFSETASRLSSLEYASGSDRAADVSEKEVASGSPEASNERAVVNTDSSAAKGSGFPPERGKTNNQLAPSASFAADGGSVSGNVIDLYSGVGSIGLTIGGSGVTLVESNEHAVREMKRNIEELDIDATPILAASEQALEYITGDKIVIVDPPRAGLHADVIARLLEVRPPRIIYLSCNPVTQARDIELLAEAYGMRAYKGYNFFPRTPHIEGLAVLEIR